MQEERPDGELPDVQGFMEGITIDDMPAQEAPTEKVEAEVPKELSAEDKELEKALKDGYNPNHPSGYTPREFNLRGELIEKLDRLGKVHQKDKAELKELRAMVASMQSSMSRQESRALEKDAQALLGARREAIESGDADRFEALDKQYQHLQQSIQEVQKPSASAPINNAAEAFRERNAAWFNYDTAENQVMHDEALAFGQRYTAYREQQGLAPLTDQNLGKKIEEYIQTKFPHRFENPEAQKPQAVVSSNSPVVGRTKAESGLEDLSERQKQSYLRLKATDPGITPEKYLKMVHTQVAIIE